MYLLIGPRHVQCLEAFPLNGRCLLFRIREYAFGPISLTLGCVHTITMLPWSILCTTNTGCSDDTSWKMICNASCKNRDLSSYFLEPMVDSWGQKIISNKRTVLFRDFLHSHFNVRLLFSRRSTTIGMDYEWVVTFVVLYPVEKLNISFGICNNGTFLPMVFQEKSIRKAFFLRDVHKNAL